MLTYLLVNIRWKDTPNPWWSTSWSICMQSLTSHYNSSNPMSAWIHVDNPCRHSASHMQKNMKGILWGNALYTFYVLVLSASHAIQSCYNKRHWNHVDCSDFWHQSPCSATRKKGIRAQKSIKKLLLKTLRCEAPFWGLIPRAVENRWRVLPLQ